MYRIAIINQFKSLVEPLTLSNETFELCLALSSGLLGWLSPCLPVWLSECLTVNPGSAFHAPCGTFVCTMPCWLPNIGQWMSNWMIADSWRQQAISIYQLRSQQQNSQIPQILDICLCLLITQQLISALATWLCWGWWDRRRGSSACSPQLNEQKCIFLSANCIYEKTNSAVRV